MSRNNISDRRQALTRARRVVVKIGSALLTCNGHGLNVEGIDDWATQIAGLRRQKVEMGLVQAYETASQRHGLHTAQVLLTHDDLANRNRYLNARSTLNTLLGLGVVPVINENDTVATEEIRFGDNDTLAALVANLVEADLLVILTDQAGLYERDPRQDETAKLVHEGAAGDARLLNMAGDSGSLGRGGMRTKLSAAERAAHSGTATVIASGREANVLARVLAGEVVGTHLRPAQERLPARQHGRGPPGPGGRPPGRGGRAGP